MDKWQIGQERILEITGLSHEAVGIGRVDGRVVFIPDTIPGDLAKIRLAHLKKRLSYGEVIEILEKSSDRRNRSCPHALTCGGCQLQHLDYAAQLIWKRQQVVDALERIGKLDVKVLPTLGMNDPYHYRNKSQLPLAKEHGKVVMGFFKKGSHAIVDLETCEIQHPLITKLALAVKRIVQELAIEPYDEIKNRGILRHAVIRVSFSRKELMLILVTRTPDLPFKEQLIKKLTEEVPELISVAHNINPLVTNVIMGRETKVIWGAEYLMETIGHLKFAISPGSFFQVNPIQTKVLYDLVKKRLDLQGEETVLDLYCGAGTIGLYLAEGAKKVIGVETFKAAVEDARYNAKLNGIEHAQFHVGKAEAVVPRLLKDEQKIDAVVLDPPRKGCDPSLLDTLLRTKIPRICYVSCNPATLARDLACLEQGGYQIGAVQPVDMFPWTRHVEAVTLLVR